MKKQLITSASTARDQNERGTSSLGNHVQNACTAARVGGALSAAPSKGDRMLPAPARSLSVVTGDAGTGAMIRGTPSSTMIASCAPSVTRTSPQSVNSSSGLIHCAMSPSPVRRSSRPSRALSSCNWAAAMLAPTPTPRYRVSPRRTAATIGAKAGSSAVSARSRSASPSSTHTTSYADRRGFAVSGSQWAAVHPRLRSRAIVAAADASEVETTRTLALPSNSAAIRSSGRATSGPTRQRRLIVPAPVVRASAAARRPRHTAAGCRRAPASDPDRASRTAPDRRCGSPPP